MTPIKSVCWVLIGLAVLAALVGSYFSKFGGMFLLTPEGYWRAVVALLLFAVTLRVMDMKA